MERWGRCGATARDKDRADYDHGKQGEQFRKRQNITQPGSSLNANDINCGYESNKYGQAECAGDGFMREGQELSQVTDEEVGVRGESSDLGEPEHPSNLNTDERSKRDASIEVGAAGFRKARSYLCETSDDNSRDGPSK